jgi:hypothetical protein
VSKDMKIYLTIFCLLKSPNMTTVNLRGMCITGASQCTILISGW